MLGLLKRHEVQVLLKAGHKRTEVSRLTEISRSSVQRISAEAQLNNSMIPLRTRSGESVGQVSLSRFWETISDILEKQPDLGSLAYSSPSPEFGLQWGQDRPLRGSGVVAPDQFDQHAEQSL
jgi:hypothetical protein